MNRSVMSSISLPRLEETTLDSTRFNQTVSLADITERPTESFQVSEDRATTEAYSLYHDFLHVFQVVILTYFGSLPNLESTCQYYKISRKISMLYRSLLHLSHMRLSPQIVGKC